MKNDIGTASITTFSDEENCNFYHASSYNSSATNVEKDGDDMEEKEEAASNSALLWTFAFMLLGIPMTWAIKYSCMKCLVSVWGTEKVKLLILNNEVPKKTPPLRLSILTPSPTWSDPRIFMLTIKCRSI